MSAPSTLAEIWKGIEFLDPSQKRTELQEWFTDDLLKQFDGHVLAVELSVAREFGTLAARLTKSGKKMPILDALIAATALVHGLTLVTRNETDFAPSGVRVYNPWKR